MFVLSEVRQVVRLMPRSFKESLQDQVGPVFGVWYFAIRFPSLPGLQVTEEINKKVANKVVVGLGLCLALYDITEIGESFIFPGDSATHTKVQQFS